MSLSRPAIRMKTSPTEESKTVILIKEEFRQIADHKDFLVSDLGRVWSKSRCIFLEPYISSGYDIVRLTHGKKCSIHRLVCTAFKPNPLNKRTVDHINRDRLDNRASNLRWATHGENNRNKINTVSPDLPLGVHMHSKKYEAQIRIAGKKRHIGCFATPEEASEAYQKVRSSLLNSSVPYP
jgi:hypothetical protein